MVKLKLPIVWEEGMEAAFKRESNKCTDIGGGGVQKFHRPASFHLPQASARLTERDLLYKSLLLKRQSKGAFGASRWPSSVNSGRNRDPSASCRGALRRHPHRCVTTQRCTRVKGAKHQRRAAPCWWPHSWQKSIIRDAKQVVPPTEYIQNITAVYSEVGIYTVAPAFGLSWNQADRLCLLVSESRS